MPKLIRKTRKIKRTQPTLRNTYGTMILPKGLILYHTSSEKFQPNNSSFTFFTFHPSEWFNFKNEVVTTVELNQDIELFFMVEGISRIKRIHSLLNTLTHQINVNYKNLNKQHNVNLKCYLPYLRAENFDGWFSTIEGKTAVEVALINNPKYYRVLDTRMTNRNWIRDDEFTTNIRYPIYTINNKIKLCINRKYEMSIKEYVKEPHYFPFQIVLNNADIEYFDRPIENIFWDC